MRTSSLLALVIISVKQTVVNAFTPQLTKRPGTRTHSTSSSGAALINQPSYYDNHQCSSSMVILQNSLYDEEEEPSSSSIPMNNSTTTATVKRKKKGKYQTVSGGVAGGGKGKNKKSKNPPGSNHAKYYPHPDTLPFLVKVTTPDPYTNNEDMKQMAMQNTKQDREFQKYKQEQDNKKQKKKGNKNKKKNKNGRRQTNSISSSIYTRHEDGTLQKILGEFTLDKSTCSGDIITVNTANVLTTDDDDDDGFLIGASSSSTNTGTTEIEYQVQSAKSQYKYVGGQKFIMVRKILEVKEIKRMLVEKEIQELFDKDITDEDEPPLLE
jgi:hypothetical protein